MGSRVQDCDDDSYLDLVFTNEDMVVIEFTGGDWCSPCQEFHHVVESVAENHPFDFPVTFLRLNIDNNPQTPGEEGIKGVPAVCIYLNKEKAITRQGLLSRETLLDLMTKAGSGEFDD